MYIHTLCGTRICVHVCTYVCMYAYKYVCECMLIYIYIYTHIYLYIYISLSKFPSKRFGKNSRVYGLGFRDSLRFSFLEVGSELQEPRVRGIRRHIVGW